MQELGESIGKTGVPDRFLHRESPEDRKCLKSCAFSGLHSSPDVDCASLLGGKGLNCGPLDLADTKISSSGIWIPVEGLLNGLVWPMGISWVWKRQDPMFQTVCKISAAAWGKDRTWESEDWIDNLLTVYCTISWVEVIPPYQTSLAVDARLPCSNSAPCLIAIYGHVWSNGLSASCVHKFSSSSSQRQTEPCRIKTLKKNALSDESMDEEWREEFTELASSSNQWTL